MPNVVCKCGLKCCPHHRGGPCFEFNVEMKPIMVTDKGKKHVEWVCEKCFKHTLLHHGVKSNA